MFSGADVAGKVWHTSGFPPHLRLFFMGCNLSFYLSVLFSL